MIKVIVCTYTSERDLNGNCRHFTRFYNTAKSRQEAVVMKTGGENNARHTAYELAGDDYEAMLEFTTVLPKREWWRARNAAMSGSKIAGLREGSPECRAALKALFA
ncbi:hypothetical protein LCGC14_1102810 [marine sediment metagenome]|uniref:Uncharacterized protein n=1 Tax=marine sediment metagenome TaxID=412755 RepID=A0A0F9PSA7_9ZZZZ